MSVQDPFYLVREEIQDSVKEVISNFNKWNSLPVGNSEKYRYGKELQGGCDSLFWQLDELDEAIKMASKDYTRFHIEEKEIQSRKTWIKSCRKQIEDVQDQLTTENSIPTNAQTADSAPVRDSARARPSSTQAKLQRAHEEDNQNFIGDQSQEQEMLMRRQDEQLDDLSHSVSRIGLVSLNIGQELDEQGNMLEDLEEDLDGVKARLGAMTRKLQNVIKKSGFKGQLIMIVVLLVLLVVLIMIAFS